MTGLDPKEEINGLAILAMIACIFLLFIACVLAIPKLVGAATAGIIFNGLIILITRKNGR